ncbi:MAG TPA: glutaminyl-peptide cyclotransferase, partial [Puia sp.]|nr:glutaminyl-peptide cyclotransferase [Puia sp.]
MIISKGYIRDIRITYLLFVALIVASACTNDKKSKESTETYAPADQPLPIEFKILNVFPHDTAAYTEGFLFHHGQLFESTGHTNSFPSSRSIFGPVDLKNGNIDPRVEIDKNKYFGEGIAVIGNKLFQLTWKDTDGQIKKGFIYDIKTFKKIGEFDFPSKEGWGMTSDGT